MIKVAIVKEDAYEATKEALKLTNFRNS